MLPKKNYCIFFGLLLLLIAFIIRLFTLPSAPGDFYEPGHYYNLFLPDFGRNSNVAILNQAYTVIGQYVILKSFLVLFNNDILLLTRFFYLVSPLLSFCGFYLLLKLPTGKNKHIILLSGFLALFIQWGAIPLLFGMIAIYSAYNGRKTKSSIVVMVITFTAVALYWHTANMIFLTAIASILLGILIFRVKGIGSNCLHKLLIIIGITALVWILIRGPQLSSISDFFGNFDLLDPTVLYRGFQKGSFIPGDYQYSLNSILSETIFDYFRYFVYGVASLGILIFSIKNFSSNKKENGVLTISIFSGTVVLMALYFIATGTLAPASILILVIPLFLTLSFKSIKQARKFAPFIVLLLLFCGILAATTFQKIYNDVKSYPEYSESFDSFYSPSAWLANHAISGTQIMSDCNTLGYLAIWYGYDRSYEKTLLSFVSISNTTYGDLMLGKLSLSSKEIYVYNYDLFQNHLVLRSLQAWNTFEPLPPSIVETNKLNLIYNNYDIWTLTR